MKKTINFELLKVWLNLPKELKDLKDMNDVIRTDVVEYLTIEMNEAQASKLKTLIQQYKPTIPNNLNGSNIVRFFLKHPFSNDSLYLTANFGSVEDAKKIVNDLIKQAINDCKIN